MGKLRSAPTGNPQRPKSPAIIRAETVENLAVHTVRWTSIGLLVVSFIGAIIAFNGSWPTSWRFWEQLSVVAVVAGIAVQGFCTLMEWANRKNRLSPKYFGPLLLDIGSTYIGFAPLLVPIFEKGLLRAQLPANVALATAHLGVVVLAMWLAVYPEQNLIEE